MPDFVTFGQQLAEAAGEAILPFFRQKLEIENKGAKAPFDPVTAADRAAETAMRALIQKHFPKHGIIGEEFAPHNPQADYLWILDPIDGTKGFIYGLPTWGVLIGVTFKGVPLYGAMHQPFVRETFWGDGKIASLHNFLGTSSLKVRACVGLSHALLSTTSPHNFKEDEKKAYLSVEEKAKTVRYGADCYAYALLAAGQLDLVVEAGLAAYDILPLIPILQGAGAIVTNWQGGSPLEGGQIIAAGDQRVYQEARALLQKASL